jgi:hypothetical protein
METEVSSVKIALVFCSNFKVYECLEFRSSVSVGIENAKLLTTLNNVSSRRGMLICSLLIFT